MKILKCLVLGFSLMLMFAAHAAEAVEAAAVDYAEAVNKAGKQRMLSQRIAKAYLFHGQRIRTEKARRQLVQSIDEFLLNHAYLKDTVKFKGVQDMLNYVEFSIEEYAALVKKPYSEDNAREVLDLSETLLEASHDIVLKIETLAQTQKSKTINVSGRQRMLSQRIAKFYIAYQSGFTEEETVRQLEKAVNEFQTAQDMLLEDPLNNEEISTKLVRTQRLWEIVRGFFLDIETGGLPVTVFTTTDAIMKNMNSVTGMYVEAEAKGKA